MIPVRQLDIETKAGFDREGWLRHLLAKPFEFEHRGEEPLYWTPGEDWGDGLFGLIQKKTPHMLHRPPHEGGREIVEQEWQGAHVLIDPTSHEQGQRMAVENDVVGKPEALMRSFQKALNDRAEAPFQFEIEPLFDPRSFWAFAEEHGGVLKSVTFDFVTPNMWGTKSALDKELKATREQTGAERVRVGLDSEHGVEAKSDRVKDGVDYAERGAGSVKAKSLGGDTYKSESSSRRTMLVVPDSIRGIGRDFLREMRSKILGLE